jgi:hypothetical protein
VLSQPDTNSELFTVGATSGYLMTAARIDREALCHYSIRCQLLVYVAIQQTAGAYFVTVKVRKRSLFSLGSEWPKIEIL